MTPTEGDFGPENRTEYARDEALHATVIPSHRKGGEVGGSMGFDAQNPQIEQNIVVCEGGEMRTIAVVEPGALAKGSEKKASPDEADVEQTFLNASNKAPKQAPAGRAVPPVDTDIPTRVEVDETHEIPPATLDVPNVTIPKRTTVPVAIKGTFGRVRQQYSSVFRDGNQLVLMSRNAELGTTYELPEIEGEEAMVVEVQVNKKTLTCVWAGIQFTMPDDSVTFTVLFIAEEQDDG